MQFLQCRLQQQGFTIEPWNSNSIDDFERFWALTNWMQKSRPE
jgi:hypothetical protein